jgi:hypothetical protein
MLAVVLLNVKGMPTYLQLFVLLLKMIVVVLGHSK